MRLTKQISASRAWETSTKISTWKENIEYRQHLDREQALARLEEALERTINGGKTRVGGKTGKSGTRETNFEPALQPSSFQQAQTFSEVRVSRR
jgi:hypothetical protein